MRRKTRLAPTAKVIKEIDETAIPRRLLSIVGGDEVSIFYLSTGFGNINERVQLGYTPKIHI